MERNRTVDVAKCLFIVFTVFVHAAMCMGKSSVVPSGVDAKSVVMTFGYSGLLMFFAFSGYFYDKKRTFSENAKKRFLQLFVPGVILGMAFPALMLIPMSIKGLHVDFDLFWQCVAENVFGEQFIESAANVSDFVYMEYFCCCGPLYFLQSLFAACLIFYALAKTVLKDWRYSIVAIIVLSLTSGILMDSKIYLPFFFHEGPLGAAFMIIGAMAKKHDLLNYMENGWRSAKYWVALALCVAGAVVLLILFPIKMELHNSAMTDEGWWASPFYVISMALAGFVLVTLMSFVSKIPKVSDVFVKGCRYSFYVYLMHMFVLKFVSVSVLDFPSIHDVELPFSGLPQALLFGLIAVAVSFGLSYVVVERKRLIGRS